MTMLLLSTTTLDVTIAASIPGAYGGHHRGGVNGDDTDWARQRQHRTL
jgi:hypothetical protein